MYTAACFRQDFLKQEGAVLKDFEKCKQEWASSRKFETLQRSFLAVASNRLDSVLELKGRGEMGEIINALPPVVVFVVASSSSSVCVSVACFNHARTSARHKRACGPCLSFCASFLLA